MQVWGENEESNQDINLTVNKKFAKKYEDRMRKVELNQLREKEKRGEFMNSSGESSEESESEDEEGEELTKEMNQTIMKTLKMIKDKDPAIYDSSVSFFPENEEQSVDEKSKEKKEKPLYYKDLVRRQVLMEENNIVSDEELERPVVMTHKDEQEKLRGDFLSSVNEAADRDPEEDFFEKSTTQEANFTERSVKATDDDEFLNTFLAEEGWKEKRSEHENRIAKRLVEEQVSDAEDLDKADAFEAKYNFRFEEEGSGQIRTFSRNVPHSMRRKDEARKLKRAARIERKALDRKKREEELRHLKNLKQQQIEEKMKKVVRMAGNGDVVSEDSELERLKHLMDLDGDFDPEEHDKKMQEMFDDSYYEQEDDKSEIFKAQEESDLVDSTSTYPVMECLTDDEDDNSSVETKAKAAESKNLSNEINEKKTELLEELYALDYEDLIGDMPCRFKYRSVEKNDYGLATSVLLQADDKDLKKFVSLKRLAPYSEYEFTVNSKKAKQFSSHIKKSLEAEAADEKQVKDEKEEAKRQQNAAQSRTSLETSVPNEDEKKKRRKRKKKKSQNTDSSKNAGMVASRLESYRLKPLK